MRGLQWISTLMCSTTLVLAACSREPEQPALAPADPTGASSAMPTEQQPLPAPPEPSPGDSLDAELEVTPPPPAA